jgi:O-antigen ligase
VALVCAAAYLAATRVASVVVWRCVAVSAPVLLVVVPLGLYGDARLLWVQQFFPRASDDLSGRLVVWPYARAAWAEHVWTGLGPLVFRQTNPLGIGPHSLLLTLGVDLGLIGAVVYLAAVVAALAAACRAGDAGRRMAGVLLVCWLPIWLTGHWELSPSAWLVLAMWSRLPLVLTPKPALLPQEPVSGGVQVGGGLVPPAAVLGYRKALEQSDRSALIRQENVHRV